MSKPVIIQVCDKKLPKADEYDVVQIDCRLQNDFCSLAGDALVGDLKDKDGTPYYMLTPLVGRLLIDFKTVDEKLFNSIMQSWYDMLGRLLQDGPDACDKDIVLSLPEKYIEWLIDHENPYYTQVGSNLKQNKGILPIPVNDIYEEVTDNVCRKISQALNDCDQEDWGPAVFNNPVVRLDSYIIKKVNNLKLLFIDCTEFGPFIQQLIEDTAKSTQKEAPEDKNVFAVGKVKFRMIPVEGGSFSMGKCEAKLNPLNHPLIKMRTMLLGELSPALLAIKTISLSHLNSPPHQVELDSFSIGETPVTQELWTAVMGDNPSSFKGDILPVDNVSWMDCQTFIQKLNSLTGQKFRLPTEAEWEFAARGGNKTKGFIYSGSDCLDTVAWFGDNSRLTTHDVKSKAANELGIYDMSGNVYEWCNDWYSHNFKFDSAHKNPKGPSTGLHRICRGGCWRDYCFLDPINFFNHPEKKNWFLTISRNYYSPTSHDNTIGLRLAL